MTDTSFESNSRSLAGSAQTMPALTQGQGDVEAEQDAYQQKYRERVVQNLTQRARQMGFELIPTAIT